MFTIAAWAAFALANATPVLEAPPVPEEGARTLWLVQPLYPGQEFLVARTEETLGQLFGPATAAREIIGRAQLAQQRLGAEGAIDCLFGDAACADPVGALLSSNAIDRVILIRAGQDGSGYHLRVVSFGPGAEAIDAERSHAALEDALLGALVQVAPIASALAVESDPPGATVLVDGEVVGLTPLSTQALPGERTIRLELADHVPVEWVEKLPIRGEMKLQRQLGVQPARLLVTSTEAAIVVDGKELGVGQAEAELAAGSHRVQFFREGHHPWETTVELKPGEELRLEKELEPTDWHRFTRTLDQAQEAIYAHGSYLSLSYDSISLDGERFAGQAISLGAEKSARALDAPALWGVSGAYGVVGRYFGLMIVGGSYFQSSNPFRLGIQDPDPDAVDFVQSNIYGGSLRLLHPQLRLAVWRFALGVQGGFYGRAGHAATAEGPEFRKGFLFYDIGLELQGGLQYYVVESFYLEGAYRKAFALTGSLDGTDELRGGIGYAF